MAKKGGRGYKKNRIKKRSKKNPDQTKFGLKTIATSRREGKEKERKRKGREGKGRKGRKEGRKAFFARFAHLACFAKLWHISCWNLFSNYIYLTDLFCLNLRSICSQDVCCAAWTPLSTICNGQHLHERIGIVIVLWGEALRPCFSPPPNPPSRFCDRNSTLHTCEHTSLHTHISIFCIYSCESI